MALVPYEIGTGLEEGYNFVRNAEAARDLYSKAKGYYSRAKGYYGQAKRGYNKAKGYYKTASDFFGKSLKKRKEPVTDINQPGRRRRTNSETPNQPANTSSENSNMRRNSNPGLDRGKYPMGWLHNAQSNVRGVIVKPTKKKRSKSKLATLKKRVQLLERNAPKLAVYDYRTVNDGYCEHGSNQCSYNLMYAIDSSLFEGSIDALPIFDEGTGAVAAVDITGTGNNAMKVDYRYIYSKCVARNNSQVPVYCDCYLVRCTKDTSRTFLDYMGDEDSIYGVTYTNDILLYPSDFPLAKKSWSIEKHCKGFLQVGDQLELSYSQKKATYNPRETDINVPVAATASTYHKGDTMWIFRTQGPISQDATTDTNIGTAAGKVDIAVTRKMKIYYPSVAPYKKIETANNFATNSGDVGAPDTEQASHV